MKVQGGVEVQNSQSYSRNRWRSFLLAGEEIPLPMEWVDPHSRYERLAGQINLLPVNGNQTPIAYYASRYY